MLTVKRIVLDVLKPHHPNGLDFALAVAEQCPACRVTLTVSEMDEKTETLVLVIEGEELHYEAISDTIAAMGASVHSIDEVAVENSSESV